MVPSLRVPFFRDVGMIPPNRIPVPRRDDLGLQRARTRRPWTGHPLAKGPRRFGEIRERLAGVAVDGRQRISKGAGRAHPALALAQRRVVQVRDAAQLGTSASLAGGATCGVQQRALPAGPAWQELEPLVRVRLSGGQGRHFLRYVPYAILSNYYRRMYMSSVICTILRHGYQTGLRQRRRRLRRTADVASAGPERVVRVRALPASPHSLERAQFEVVGGTGGLAVRSRGREAQLAALLLW